MFLVSSIIELKGKIYRFRCWFFADAGVVKSYSKVSVPYLEIFVNHRRKQNRTPPFWPHFKVSRIWGICEDKIYRLWKDWNWLWQKRCCFSSLHLKNLSGVWLTKWDDCFKSLLTILKTCSVFETPKAAA